MRAMLLLLLLPAAALAGPAATRDSLDRLEEILELRIEDRLLDPDDLMPAILVSAQPRYEASAEWFATSAAEVLMRALGESGLRLCEACMVPQALVEDGYMLYQTGPLSLPEIVRLDDLSRGEALPARSAIWIDEHRSGVAVRIVDLRTGRVLFAQNIDPDLIEYTNTQRIYSMSEELERRARGDSLTHVFVDFALYPGQHVSIDWTEQWGRYNRSMTGLSVSAFDPVLGLGGAHYQTISEANITLGGKVLMSIPTAAVNAIGEGGDVLDPLVTIVGVVRVPFGRSNYGAVVSASTNGQLGVGISLLNISLLPLLP